MDNSQKFSRVDSLIESTLNFINLNLAKVDSFEIHWNTNEQDFIRGVDKIIAETLLLLLILNRSQANKNKSISKIVSYINHVARSHRNASLILQYPSLSTSLGIPHIVLTKLGYTDSHFDFIVRKSIFSKEATGKESLPFRAMDLNWIRFIYSNNRNYLEKTKDYISASIVGSKVHSIFLNRDDFYALTHCLMYLSDFGEIEIIDNNINIKQLEQNLEDAIKLSLIHISKSPYGKKKIQ